MKFKTSAAVERIAINEPERLTQKYLPVTALVPDSDNAEIYNMDISPEMLESVKQDGILQPLLIRPNGIGTYTIVAGHRRWTHAKAAGLTEVPCLIRKIENEEELINAKIDLILTNQLVRDRTPAERAKEIEYLEEQFKELKRINPKSAKGSTRSFIAQATNLSERQVADYQNVNKNLSAEQQEAFQSGDLSLSEAVSEIRKKKQKVKRDTSADSLDAKEPSIFKDEEHRTFYFAKCKSIGFDNSYQLIRYKTLVYCVGIDKTIREQYDSLFNEATGEFQIKASLNQRLSPDARQAVTLAFHLYDSSYISNATPSALFDSKYQKYFFEAIKLRYPNH